MTSRGMRCHWLRDSLQARQALKEQETEVVVLGRGRPGVLFTRNHGVKLTIQLFLVTAMVTDTEGRKHNEGSCEWHFLRRVARHLGWTSAVKGVDSSHLISYWSPVRRSFHAGPRWVHSLGIFDTRWAPGPLVPLMQLADGLQVRSRVYRLGSLSRECVGYAFGLRSCCISHHPLIRFCQNS